MTIAEGAEGDAAEQRGLLAAVCTVVEPDSPTAPGSRHAADRKPNLNRQQFYEGCHEQVKPSPPLSRGGVWRSVLWVTGPVVTVRGHGSALLVARAGCLLCRDQRALLAQTGLPRELASIQKLP